MRIISGQHKGRKIMAPKKLPVRPTTDMAKEALFNILRHSVHFTDLTILELYAGSGNISYEFTSRGAVKVTAVDRHAACVKFIEETATLLELPIDAIKDDAHEYLKKTHSTYDLVFADPPYDLPLEDFEAIINLTFEHDLLNDDGFIVIEHSKHTSLEHHDRFENARRYGGTVFSFFS